MAKVLIPINKKRNNVPHYVENRKFCEDRVKEARNILEDGFKPPIYVSDYVPVMYRSRESWEAWYRGIIDMFDYEWREPWIIKDCLKIIGYSRGRSAAYFDAILVSSGIECSIFMTDMTKIILASCIDHGVVDMNSWIFCKRGSNYGVRLYDD